MFKNRIREVRQGVGLSQTKLSCLVGIAEPAMSNLELGKCKPWPKVRRDIAKVLRVPEEELFPDES